MKDGKLTDFLDQLYYGQELVFSYQGKKYFIQGWWDKEKSMATMVLTDESVDSFTGYLWEHNDTKMKHCAEAFLSAPIWEGKDFLQIEADVTWCDW